jgi:phage-related minor tail protein
MFFDGKINSRKVNLGRSNNNAKPNDILAQVKSERENRQRSREESKAVAIIKKLVETKLELKQFEKEQKNIYFEQISQPGNYLSNMNTIKHSNEMI